MIINFFLSYKETYNGIKEKKQGLHLMNKCA